MVDIYTCSKYNVNAGNEQKINLFNYGSFPLPLRLVCRLIHYLRIAVRLGSSWLNLFNQIKRTNKSTFYCGSGWLSASPKGSHTLLIFILKFSNVFVLTYLKLSNRAGVFNSRLTRCKVRQKYAKCQAFCNIYFYLIFL